MSKTKGTYLALLAVLLSPMAANADLIEIETTIDVSFLSGATGWVYNSGLPFGENAIISEGDSVSVFVDFSGTQTVTATDMTNFNSWLVTDYINGFSSNFTISDAYAELVGASSQPATTSSQSGGNVNIGITNYFASTTLTFSGYNFGFTVDSLLQGTSEYSGLWWVAKASSFAVTGSRDIESEGTSITYASVPEPSTLALFGIGLLGMAAARRRKV